MRAPVSFIVSLTRVQWLFFEMVWAVLSSLVVSGLSLLRPTSVVTAISFVTAMTISKVGVLSFLEEPWC